MQEVDPKTYLAGQAQVARALSSRRYSRDRRGTLISQPAAPPLTTLMKTRKFRKKRKAEMNMGLYIVYEVVEVQHEVKHEEFITTYTPQMLGAFHGDDAGEAITNAVKLSRRFGKYVAVEVHPMEIDLTAKQAELTMAEDEVEEEGTA